MLPLRNIRNIKFYYLLTIFTNAWYIAGNWIFYWTRFMTYGQLGVVDATAFAFGLIMEIPTGAVGDLLGKKKTLIIASLLSFIGTAMMTLSNSMFDLFIGFLFFQLGYAFYSGSLEAFGYDSLVEVKQEQKFDLVISASNQLAIVATMVTTLLGAVLYTINFRYSHGAWAANYLFALIVCFFIIEPKVVSQKFNFKSYIGQLSVGAKVLFSKELKKFVLLILSLLGVYYLYDWGLVRPAIATSFGFYDKEQAIIYAVLSLITAFCINYLPKLRNTVSDYAGLIVLSLFMGIGFLLSSFNLNYYGLIPLTIIGLAGGLAYPWISIVVNREVSSEYRATTLSTVALITKLPYVLVAITAGQLIEAGYIRYFNLGVALVIFSALFVNYIRLKFNKARI